MIGAAKEWEVDSCRGERAHEVYMSSLSHHSVCYEGELDKLSDHISAYWQFMPLKPQRLC